MVGDPVMSLRTAVTGLAASVGAAATEFSRDSNTDGPKFSG